MPSAGLSAASRSGQRCGGSLVMTMSWVSWALYQPCLGGGCTLSPATRSVTQNRPASNHTAPSARVGICSCFWGRLGGDRGERMARLKSVFSIKRRKSSKTHSGLNITVKSMQAALPLQSNQQFMCVIAGRWFLFVLKMNNPSSQRISSETIWTDLEVQCAF